MAGFSFQFHALPEEVSLLLDGLLADRTIHVTELLREPPVIRSLNRDEVLVHDVRRRALLFTQSEPDLTGFDMNAPRTMDHDVLVLEIGSLTADGLGESWLWTMSEDDRTMVRWRKAANALKKHTLTGAIAMNPLNGATALYRGHRFTHAARAAYLGGVQIIPCAGNSILKLA